MEGCIDQVPVVHAVIWLIMLVDCNIHRMLEWTACNRNLHGEINESCDRIYSIVTGCFFLRGCDPFSCVIRIPIQYPLSTWIQCHRKEFACMCCSSYMFQCTHWGILHSYYPYNISRRIPALRTPIRKYRFQGRYEKLFCCPCIPYLGGLVFFVHKSKSTPPILTRQTNSWGLVLKDLIKAGGDISPVGQTCGESVLRHMLIDFFLIFLMQYNYCYTA